MQLCHPTMMAFQLLLISSTYNKNILESQKIRSVNKGEMKRSEDEYVKVSRGESLDGESYSYSLWELEETIAQGILL